MSSLSTVSDDLVTLSDGNFKQVVIQSTKPVLVDLWADWSQPCTELAPIVEELAEDYGDQLLVGKLDVDTNPAVTEIFGIWGIPALLLFQNGKVVRKILGTPPKKKIQEAIKEYL